MLCNDDAALTAALEGTDADAVIRCPAIASRPRCPNSRALRHFLPPHCILWQVSCVPVARPASACPKPRQQRLAGVALEQPPAGLIQTRNVRDVGEERRHLASHVGTEPPLRLAAKQERHALVPRHAPRLRLGRASCPRPPSLLPNGPASRPTSPSCLLLFLPRAFARIPPATAGPRPDRSRHVRPPRAGAVRPKHHRL